MQGSITVIPRHRNEADAPKCECLAQDHRAEVGNQDSNPGCLAPEPHSSCSIFTLYRGKCVLVIQLCPTLCNPMDYSPPSSSVHDILQARILERVTIPFFRGIFPTQERSPDLLHGRQVLYPLSHQGSSVTAECDGRKRPSCSAAITSFRLHHCLRLVKLTPAASTQLLAVLPPPSFRQPPLLFVCL